MELPNYLKDHNLYGLLGIATFSELNEIKRGYRNFALKYHPDRFPINTQAGRIFDLGTQAYKILVNEETRSRYNRMLRNRLRKILNLRNRGLVLQCKKIDKRFYNWRSFWDLDYTRSIKECRADFKEYLKNIHTVKARPRIFSKNTMDADIYQDFVEAGRSAFQEYLDSLPRIRRREF